MTVVGDVFGGDAVEGGFREAIYGVVTPTSVSGVVQTREGAKLVHIDNIGYKGWGRAGIHLQTDEAVVHNVDTQIDC